MSARDRTLGAGLLALAAIEATAAGARSFGTAAIRYRTSPTILNQVIVRGRPALSARLNRPQLKGHPEATPQSSHRTYREQLADRQLTAS